MFGNFVKSREYSLVAAASWASRDPLLAGLLRAVFGSGFCSRKRRDNLESEGNSLHQSSSGGDLPIVVQRGMAELPEGAAPPEDQHPLTAATTAMLNISGGAEDQSTAMGLIYEYYKFQPISGESKDKLADIWP